VKFKKQGTGKNTTEKGQKRNGPPKKRTVESRGRRRKGKNKRGRTNKKLWHAGTVGILEAGNGRVAWCVETITIVRNAKEEGRTSRGATQEMEPPVGPRKVVGIMARNLATCESNCRVTIWE